MLRRCASIVRVLSTSCSAISRFVRPPATSRRSRVRARSARRRSCAGGALDAPAEPPQFAYRLVARAQRAEPVEGGLGGGQCLDGLGAAAEAASARPSTSRARAASSGAAPARAVRAAARAPPAAGPARAATADLARSPPALVGSQRGLGAPRGRRVRAGPRRDRRHTRAGRAGSTGRALAPRPLGRARPRRSAPRRGTTRAAPPRGRPRRAPAPRPARRARARR